MPAGYWLLSWDERLVEGHAVAKFESFRFELDANVFPCLGDLEGCHRLVREIFSRPGLTSGHMARGDSKQRASDSSTAVRFRAFVTIEALDRSKT
ncbi:MAG: hypothetical protein R3B96_09260 [Pirellulaceae bacterium]